MYNCNKLLIITPHLSTGGSPQYLLEFIKKYKNNFNEIKVVEYSIFSTDYIVQKEKIKKIIGEENLISLGFLYEPEIIFTENRKKLVTLIETYEPDIIWMNESPENYEYRAPLLEVTEIIYSKNRKHKIIETTHNNAFDFNQKIFIPDEFLFCSNKHIKDSQSIVIPKKVWDIPIENKQRPDRKKTLLELGLCPEKLHVLNVGLFNTNKNQKYIFEIAKKLPNVEFHFVGNTCFLEECCINEDLNLDNCTIWGERNDVDKFMSCMDIFLFPSRKELNPISVKEALSWGMEVIANRDRNYTDQYLGLKNFILIDQIDVIKYIKERNKFNDINITFKNGVTVEILGEHRNEYHIKFYNRDNGELIHEGVIYNNMWIKPNPQYFVNWRIDIYMNGSKILEKNLNLKGKKILISYESKSLGDSIAWVPYVEEFRKKHDCEVYCATFRNFLFEKSYPNIKFVNVGMNEDEFYANYRLGWFFDTNKNPNDVRLIPLQKTASDILGLNFKEIKTKIDFNPNFENTYGKYITLSTHSTSKC